ncbi:MAG: hypothetical protein JWQ02_715 [Capsulimonas sp.]|nr:hypothetical protein [Capsulimonas sp.]
MALECYTKFFYSQRIAPRVASRSVNGGRMNSPNPLYSLIIRILLLELLHAKSLIVSAFSNVGNFDFVSLEILHG